LAHPWTFHQGCLALADFDERNIRNFIPLLRQAFILLASSNAVVFADERANDELSLTHIQSTVSAARTAMRNVYESHFDRPNTHTSNAHLADSADRYGMPKNFDVRTYETNHAPFRRFIARSSNIVVERQMMEWENIKQALQFLANGGDPDVDLIPSQILRALREDPVLHKLLERAQASSPHDVPNTVPTHRHENVKWIGTAALVTLAPAERTLVYSMQQKSRKQVEEFDGVHISTRAEHVARIHKGDVWECRSKAAQPLTMPAGPRASTGLIMVQSIFRDQFAQAWVRVQWYGKKGTLQPSVQCQPYEHKSAPRYPLIVPVVCLHRRAHLVQHGVHLLLNRYFIK
jgi:hypothetical protein